jgi:ribonuclease BN (tRNA processing enzyme)
MKLTVVGCAGSFPNVEGPASCYLLEHEGFRVLLDMGSGSLGPLQKYADPFGIGAVLLSHLHADHCLDMSPFFVLRRYNPAGVPPRIPVFGPSDTGERMALAYGMDPEPGMSAVFDVRTYPEAEFEVGPFRVRAHRVYHPVTAYALRVEAGGRVLTFSGDTAPCTALVDAARDADVALFEASYRDGDDNPPGLHMTAGQSATAARRAGAGRLILTHMVAWHDNSRALEHAAAFGGDVALASPGMVVDV